MLHRPAVLVSTLLLASQANADFTRNIMVTGYWPPTNEMVRHFSTSPTQNPDGWQGGNWEGRGYDIYSYFPEFPDGVGQGVGDLEVDYQDTSEDFWRIVDEVKPLAILTFSRGSRGVSWEVEQLQRNLEDWVDDYTAPFQPTPSPPDASVPAGHIRESSLPMQDIVDAVGALEDINVVPFIDDDGFGGGFLSEFIAYHGVWYHEMNASPNSDWWNIAAGHIHVGQGVSIEDGMAATEETLRVLTGYLDGQIPAPGTVGVLALGALAGLRRRR